MGMITCPECGKQVSDTADTCPNCGYKFKKDDDLPPIWFGIIVFAVIIGAGIWGCNYLFNFFGGSNDIENTVSSSLEESENSDFVGKTYTFSGPLGYNYTIHFEDEKTGTFTMPSKTCRFSYDILHDYLMINVSNGGILASENYVQRFLYMRDGYIFTDMSATEAKDYANGYKLTEK